MPPVDDELEEMIDEVATPAPAELPHYSDKAEKLADLVVTLRSLEAPAAG